ncbi:MAG: ABC transporter permease [Verrucomicrobiota bacterium]
MAFPTSSPSSVPGALKTLLWPLAALLLLLAFNAVTSDFFLHVEMRDGRLYGTLIDILNQGAKVMILAVGMTLVIATGGVDLSVGSVMAIAGALAAVLAADAHAGLWLILPACLGLAAVLGSVNGWLVSGLKLQPIIATLILMVTGRGAAKLLTGNDISPVRTITFDFPPLRFLGSGHVLGVPFSIVLVALIFGLTVLIFRRTALGLFLEATGNNETAARFAGLPAARVKVLAYAWCGLCAGLAGLVETGNLGACDPEQTGQMMELDAIFAVVAGGTVLTGGRFSLAGSILGALLIQTLTHTLLAHQVRPTVMPVYKAVVILALCLLHSPKFRAQLARLRPRRAAAGI